MFWVLCNKAMQFEVKLKAKHWGVIGISRLHTTFETGVFNSVLVKPLCVISHDTEMFSTQSEL